MPGKGKLTSLLLAGTVLLSGCSSMLERSYMVVTAHPEHPAAADNSNVLKAETYQDLVNDVLYFVNQGVEHGAIRLTNYPRDVEADLNSACLEVARDAPVGAYAVDFIEHDCTRVVQYYEANIHITYRRTLEQIQSIKTVTGSSAVRRVLQEKLTRFAPEAVLQVSYFTEDEDYISALIRQAYYDTPAAALGMPEYTISLYPDRGRERIVEILLTYPAPAEELRRMSQLLLQQADQLSASLSGQAGPEALQEIFDLLRQRVSPAPAGEGPTAYAALLENRADSEGVALAFQLLCQTAGLDSTVVRGFRDGRAHFWNVCALPSGQHRHVDASAADGFLLTDSDAEAMGYVWDRDEIPVCSDSGKEAG